MRRNTILLQLAIVVLAGLLIGQSDRASRMVVVVNTENDVIAVDPNSGTARSNAAPRIDGALSPDGKRVAFTKVLGKGEQSSSELFVAKIDAAGKRSDERQLTNGAYNACQPHWLQDSKHVAYVRGTGEHQQVYIANVESETRSETRGSAGKARARLPHTTQDGRLAYLAESGRDGKATLYDLIIVTNGAHETIVKQKSISEYAFSTDGKKLAYSDHGNLVIVDLASGKSESRHFQTIDKRLNSFHATSLAWHPDGRTIAATLHFSGGRSADENGEIKPLFGEQEVFVIPLDGREAKWVTVQDIPFAARWMRTQ
jgi:Tol biopolymer transport system component